MIFEHTEEHRLLREMVRDFVQAEVLPSAKERVENEHFDHALMFERPADPGLTGTVFPEKYGSAGADYISYAAVAEELSRVCGSTGVTLSAYLFLDSNPIFLFGNEQQKEQCLVPLGQAEKMAAFGRTETSAVSDAGGTKIAAASKGLNSSQQYAMAKLISSETAMKVTTRTVQILRGYGSSQDFPVKRMVQDAKNTEIYEGTNEIQRLVIGRSLTR